LWQEHGGPIGLTITDPPKQKWDIFITWWLCRLNIKK
jgi:hypothetical protein